MAKDATQTLEIRVEVQDDGTVKAITDVGVKGEKAGEKVKKGFDKGRLSVKRLSDRLRAGSFLKRFAAIGLAATLAFGGVKTIKAFSSFEKGLANVSTLGAISNKTMLDMEKSVLKMAGELNKMPVDLVEGLYDAISAGAPAGIEALNLTRVAAKLATAGLTDTRTSVDALTSVLNAYKLSTSEATRISDVLFRTVELGKLRFADLAQNIGTALPQAASLGIRFEEVAAAMAEMTKSGINTARSATALRGIFSAFTKNIDQFKKAGVDIVEVLGTRGLAGGLKELDRLTRGNREALNAFIPDVQAQQVVLALAGKGLEGYNKTLERVINSTGSSAEAFRKQTKTVDAFFKNISVNTGVFQTKMGAVVLQNETVRKGFGILAKNWQEAVQNISTNSSVLNENISNTFISIVKGIRNLTLAFSGIKLIFLGSQLSLETFLSKVADLNIEMSKVAKGIGESMLKISRSLRLITEKKFSQGMAELAIEMSIVEKTARLQKEEMFKAGEALEDYADGVDVATVAFGGFLAALKKTQDVDLTQAFVGPLLPDGQPTGTTQDTTQENLLKRDVKALLKRFKMGQDYEEFLLELEKNEAKLVEKQVKLSERLNKKREAFQKKFTKQSELLTKNRISDIEKEQKAIQGVKDWEAQQLKIRTDNMEKWIGDSKDRWGVLQSVSSSTMNSISSETSKMFANMITQGKDFEGDWSDIWKNVGNTVISTLTSEGIKFAIRSLFASFNKPETAAGANVGDAGFVGPVQPSTGGALAGALAGAATGSSLGLPGAIVGGLLGGALGSGFFGRQATDVPFTTPVTTTSGGGNTVVVHVHNEFLDADGVEDVNYDKMTARIADAAQRLLDRGGDFPASTAVTASRVE